MKQKCTCGQNTNVAYIYQKKDGVGGWLAVGHFCKYCSRFSSEKKLKLTEGIRTKGNIAKGERKRV